MNAGGQITNRRVHGPVAGNAVQRAKGRSPDQDAEMAFPGTVIATVARVFVAVIDDFQPFGGESFSQARA